MIEMAWKMMYCGMNIMTNLTLTRTKKVTTCMMTHEQIQQMFNEDSDYREFLVLNKFADFSASCMWVRL